MRKLNVQFCKYYYKAVTKEVEIPEDIKEEDIEKYLLDNFPEDEVSDKDLEFEDKDIFILKY